MIKLLVGIIIGAIGYHFYITGQIDTAIEESRAAIHSATKPDSVLDQLKEKLQ
ncbi:MAG: hypothetical protein ACO4AM_07225 [Candidatus Nanopelagicaceae bacterium]